MTTYEAEGDSVTTGGEGDASFTHITKADAIVAAVQALLDTLTAPANAGPEYEAVVALLAE